MDEQDFDAIAWLTLDETSRASAVPTTWLVERVEAGLISAAGESPARWRFDAVAVRRARSMRRIESGFGAVPELSALVADLEEEVARLRAALARRPAWW